MADSDFLSGTRYTFSEENAARAPEQLGVYQIEDADSKVIYVGQGRIRDRLLSHFHSENDADECIFSHHPTAYRREVCANAAARERAILAAHNTFCNVRVG